MHKPMPRPSVRKANHATIDRRRERPRCGFIPTTKGGGPVPFESLLGADPLQQMAADPFVASRRAQPESFVWRDGVDGRRRRYSPDLLAVMTDGSRIYRSVRPHALLLCDQELSVRRARTELECSATGAAFEIWTERGIRESTNGCRLLRVATPAEATLVASLPPRSPDYGSASAVSGLVLRIANRLGHWGPWQASDTFFAHSMLTGIMMAFRCRIVSDPVTGLPVWRPIPRGA